MNIYFAGSITGGREDSALYGQLVDFLKSKGTVLTEHVGSEGLSRQGEKLSDAEIYTRDIAWLDSSDMVVAEVSTASLGVGVELMRAVMKNKRVLCLYRDVPGKRVSGMVTGCPQIVSREYSSLEEAQGHIDEFFQN